MVFSEVQDFALREVMSYCIVKFCANAQSEVKCATHFRRSFTMQSIASRTEGVLIVPYREAMENTQDKTVKAAFEAKYQKKAALLQQQNKAYNQYCEDTGLKKQSDRVTISKWDRSQAAKATAAARKYNSGIYISGNNGKLNIGIQFFAKSSKDFETVILPKQEYAHIMGEISTNLTKKQAKMQTFRKAIGNHIYTVENNGFGNYRIIGKRLIDEQTADWWDE